MELDGGTNQPKNIKKKDFKRNPLSQEGSGNEKKPFLTFQVRSFVQTSKKHFMDKQFLA